MRNARILLLSWDSAASSGRVPSGTPSGWMQILVTDFLLFIPGHGTGCWGGADDYICTTAAPIVVLTAEALNGNSNQAPLMDALTRNIKERLKPHLYDDVADRQPAPIA